MNNQQLVAALAATIALCICCFFTTRCASDEAFVRQQYVPKDYVKLPEAK